MYDTAMRQRAFSLLAQGRTMASVSRELGVAHATIRYWRAHPEPKKPSTCIRCTGIPQPPAPPDQYAYLLGLYLGDGCISSYRKGVYGLRIACCNGWPGLMDECEAAILALRPGTKVHRVPCTGYRMITSLWKHWPCLFPQHGPGPKHKRTIELVDWQREIVNAYPWPLARGLIHSDGSRFTNWTTRMVGGQPKRYEYPRYMFTNMSADIMRLMTDTLDLLGVAWKRTNHKNISVARRDSVALMDLHVGPKY
ncbi:transcriptional regulator [Streptomycetaceae bacterium NBC_01309]